MKQDKDWIDVMRSSLRDAEIPPPVDGWARLERELGAAPAPQVPAWRIYWPRVAAAAAAIVISIAAGEYLWRADHELKGYDGDVISEAVSGGAAADQILLGTTANDSAQTLAMAEPADHASAAKIPALRRAAAVNSAAAPTAFAVALPESESGESAAQEPADNAVATRAQEPASNAASKSNTASKLSSQSSRQSTSQASRRTVYGDDFVAYAPPRKKTSFSLYGGGGVSGGNTGTSSRMQANWADSPVGSDGGGNSIGLMKQYDYARGSFRHHQPLSFGLSVRKEFAHGLSLESGVNYTLLRSDVSLYTGSEQIDQKLHFIGVPLRLNWQFLERGRFSLYICAGGMVEKCVSARFEGKSYEEPKVQWSALAAAGAQYKLGGTVGLYFEPEVSYYFTQTELRTVRTDSPLTLTLRMGVRLSF